MKDIAELKQLFSEINKLKGKAPLSKSQFCSKLTSSDENEYLELHFNLLEQKKKYFQPDLKLYFTFRQNREKTHYFLKNKLKHLTDRQLKTDIEDILNDIRFHTIEEYKKWIEDIKAGKRIMTVLAKRIRYITRYKAAAAFFTTDQKCLIEISEWGGMIYCKQTTPNRF